MISRHNTGVTFHKRETKLMTGHAYELLTISIRFHGLFDIPKTRAVADKINEKTNNTYDRYAMAEAQKIDWTAANLKQTAQNVLNDIS